MNTRKEIIPFLLTMMIPVLSNCTSPAPIPQKEKPKQVEIFPSEDDSTEIILTQLDLQTLDMMFAGNSPQIMYEIRNKLRYKDDSTYVMLDSEYRRIIYMNSRMDLR